MLVERVEVEVQRRPFVPAERRHGWLHAPGLAVVDDAHGAAPAGQRHREELGVPFDIALLARRRGQPEALKSVLHLALLHIHVAVLRKGMRLYIRVYYYWRASQWCGKGYFFYRHHPSSFIIIIFRDHNSFHRWRGWTNNLRLSNEMRHDFDDRLALGIPFASSYLIREKIGVKRRLSS